MNIKKIVTYIYNAGCVVFGVGFMIKMLEKIFSLGFMSLRTTAFVMLLGIGLMAVDWFYKFCHFQEYKEENKNRLIGFVSMAVILSIVFIIKECVL